MSPTQRDRRMRVALVVTENYSAWNFRRGLLKALVDYGFETHLIAPSGQYDEPLRGLGLTHIPVHVNRIISPVNDLRFLVELYKIFRTWRFDVVHNLSIKPNIYGAFAARLAGAPRVIGSVTGLGN